MKNRKSESMKAMAEIMPKQFLKSSEQIVLFCEENAREIVHRFLKEFSVALEQAASLQDKGEKGKVSYILFSPLYSSIFLKKYLIRMDIMDNRFYSDTAQSATYWDAGNIYYLFEKDVETIAGILGNHIPRICEYEIDYIRYAYAPYYHRLVKTFIQEILGEVLKEENLFSQRIGLENEVKILFGEYMGEADVLFTLKEEGVDEIFQDICG